MLKLQPIRNSSQIREARCLRHVDNTSVGRTATSSVVNNDSKVIPDERVDEPSVDRPRPLKREIDFAPDIRGEDKRITLTDRGVGNAHTVTANNVLDARLSHPATNLRIAKA